MESHEPTTKTKTITEGTGTQVMHTDAGDLHITHHSAEPGKKPKVTVRLEPDDIVRNQVGGFVSFLREHAIVGLAVGFIIGQQAQLVVTQLVASFVTPMLSLWLGQNLATKHFIVGGHSATPFTYGKFIYALVNFLFIIIFIYAIIKLLKLDKLDRPKK